jgi:membrane-associated phospholipid phosphatase
MEFEKKFIYNNLQNFPALIYTISNLLSLPFHLNFFSLIVVILYYKNFINSGQIFLLISSQLLIIVIKYLVKRDRPFINSDIINREWMKVDYYSFPSGHTFNAFLLFYFLKQNGLIENNLISISPYLVGMSRVLLGVHYPSDVIAGGILAKILISLYYT